MENAVEQNGEQNVEKIGTSSSSSSYVCRQSSTRWTPTTEQIKILKELYYINGVRSPTADQIQAICSRLRRYGKIEGKNVFYWFQNHKARERHKKRLTPPTSINCWKQDDFTKYPTSTCINNNHFTTTTTNNNNNNNNNINNINNNNNNPGISCSSSSAGMISAAGGGQLMGSFGYGAVTMENKFRDCSISGGFNTTPQWTSPAAAAAATGGTTNYNTTSYASFPNFHDKLSATFDEDHEQDHYVVTTEIETLPLFPMHDKDNDHNNNNNNQFSRDHQFPSSAGFYTGGYRWSNGGGNGASLELTLNSYGYGCYSHNY